MIMKREEAKPEKRMWDKTRKIKRGHKKCSKSK